MKIAILGSGTVALTLARGLAAEGHQVRLGTREPGKLEALTKEVPAIGAATVREAAAFGELAVLAVKGHAAEAVVRAAGDALDGKTVLDTTNPIDDSAPPVHGVLRYFTGPNDSLLERLQALAPRVRFVKAFNSVGAPRMVHPRYAEGRPTMFVAGDDVAAKRQASSLIESLGWEVADMGPAVAARAIEPLAMLWCIPGFARDEWTHAFKLLHSQG